MLPSRSLFGTFVLFSACAAFACSCSNSTPIQKTSERYRDRAVFTAHVIQLMGRNYNFDGKRMSGQVLAVVKQRYWGLPWYWPKVVVLDGGFFCNIALEEGKDYLVSGRRTRYGVLDVSVCSRTQKIDMAEVDLRTLDGSHCTGPGGTVIGHLYDGQKVYRRGPSVPGITMTFRDQDGNPHSVQSDADGVFELQHLPAGTYTLDSHLSSTQFLAGGGFTVRDGVCGESDVGLGDYKLYGQFLSGLGGAIKLVSVDSSQWWQLGNVQSDGKFYFKDIPDGEFLIAVESTLQGAGNDFYYPGTFDRHRAAKIKVVNHEVVGSNRFDFDPRGLPYVPIRVVLNVPKESGFSWRVLLVTPDNIVGEERWTPDAKLVVLYAIQGQSYRIRLFGDPDYRTQHALCYSGDTSITAKTGLGVVHINAPTACP